MDESYRYLSSPLSTLDQDTCQLIEFEKRRQERKIILIASESICPQPVLQAQASVYSNIYAEGYPSLRMSRRESSRIDDCSRYLAFHRRYGDRRHYKGCDYVNFIEVLAQWRAALLFAHDDGNICVKPEDIFVNVQALSGAAANNAVYQALVRPGETVMGLALPHGGHLTHGSEFNRSGKLYHIVSYEVDGKTGQINYEKIREAARRYQPRMIISGASAYPWAIDWRSLREIADEVGAYLLADVAHPSGLVAAGLFPNPVGYAHAATMTTHKTLCGPRAAIILSTDEQIAQSIDNAVFPGEQGGPHINTIAALAVTFKLAGSDEYRQLMQRVVANAAALATALTQNGLSLAYGGTSTHLCLVNLNKIKNLGGAPLKGDVASNILDLCGITCNKNTIPGDITSADSSAVRFGTTWVSQMGMGQAEMEQLAGLITEVLLAIHTFSIITAGGTRGRGRIASEIMHKTRRQVAQLLKRDEHPLYPLYPHYYHFGYSQEKRSQQPAAATGTICRNQVELVQHLGDPEGEWQCACEQAVVIDSRESGLLEISGERATMFLSEVATAAITALQPGQATRSFLLDGNGAVYDDVTIWRMADGDYGYHRYWLATNPESRETVKDWLRDLSDGFVLFDHQCIYSKINGPVVVADLFEAAPALVGVTLVGPAALAILSQLDSSIATIPYLGMIMVQTENFSCHIARAGFQESQEIYQLYVELQQLPTLLEKLNANNGNQLRQAGQAVIDKLRQQAGLGGDAIISSELPKKFPGYFAGGKPYFIGEAGLLSQLPGHQDKRQHQFQIYEGEARQTPLAAEHSKLTNRALVPFAGWQMPVLYNSILQEHQAIRERAGLFDVTHMGVLEIAGAGASRFLDLVTSNYAGKLRIGQSQYSYLLDPDGTAIDDIMVYRRGEERFMMVVNAVNAEKDLEWLVAVASKQVLIDKEYPQREVDVIPIIRDLRHPDSGDDCKIDIALQGPRSLDILKKAAANLKIAAQLQSLNRSMFIETKFAGIEVLVCRSGYTGEEWGYELYVHPHQAGAFWNLLLDCGQEFGIEPTGLGARDSTRTEAGFPLYGHELAGEYDITPYEAGYAAFVKYHKPFFIGKTPLLGKDRRSKNTIVRFQMAATGIRAIRPGAQVFNKRGQFIGTVTSCTFIGNIQVGMAYVDRKYAGQGSQLAIFPIAVGKEVKHKAISDLHPGDKFPLHELASIVSRFPMRKCECVGEAE